jgi:hypothetical protein
VSPHPSSLDRRANIVAGAVVATVVLLLGFGSGIGAVVTRHNASSATPAASSAPGASADPAAGAASGLVATDSSAGASPLAAAIGAKAAGPVAAVHPLSPAVTPVRKSTAGTGAGARTSSPAAECAGQMVLDAMAEPFIVHLNKAHLEESPGQQAADLFDLDQYVKTHTVLAGSMAGPALDASIASLAGLDPFIVHLNKAHLEESPGQQAADLLDLDQYVKTHTVLVGSMAAPAADGAIAAGC